MNYPTTDEVLGSFGLMRKPQSVDWVTPSTLFGAGLLAGAAAAVLLTPRRGSEVRAEIGDAARNVGNRVSTLAQDVTHAIPGMTHETHRPRFDGTTIEAK